MLTFVISISSGLICGIILNQSAQLNIVWSICLGLAAFLVVQLLIGLLIRKKITVVNNAIQQIMNQGQVNLNRQSMQIQQKLGGNIKKMQEILGKEQKKFLSQALEATKMLEPYKKWNFLLGRQINTLRVQLYYQMKEFDKVDELIPKAIFMEPMAVAMKMARQYKNDDPDVHKTYQKKIKKFKGENALLLYGLYSWILVKQDKIDEAIKVLIEGKEVTDNETLRNNWEFLVNGKIKRFSNSGLGELWYSLYLEEPKFRKQKVKRVYR